MHTILLLTANPKDTSQLDLDREVALIADFLAQAHLSRASAYGAEREFEEVKWEEVI